MLDLCFSEASQNLSSFWQLLFSLVHEGDQREKFKIPAIHCFFEFFPLELFMDHCQPWSVSYFTYLVNLFFFQDIAIVEERSISGSSIYGCEPPNYDGPAHIHLPFWLNYYFQRCVIYNIYVLSNLLNFLKLILTINSEYLVSILLTNFFLVGQKRLENPKHPEITILIVFWGYAERWFYKVNSPCEK